MGYTIDAACECGYKVANLPIGSGKLNFETECSHVALCETGSHLEVVNLMESSHRCSRNHEGAPKPYATCPELQREPGTAVVAKWTNYELNDGTYLRPKCGQFTLRFSTSEMLVLFD